VLLFQKLKKEWFLIGIGVSIALAIVTPQIGRSGSPLHLETVTKVGIAFIFFLHGLSLSPAAIKTGVSNWKLHICTQLSTFLLYPLIWIICKSLFLAYMPTALAFGFCYLFVLPSTISSSVALTSVAKGNVPGAIFNASLSSVLGVFITPMFVYLFMGVQGAHMDLAASVISIAKLLLLPMLGGQLLRPILVHFIQKHKSVVNIVDRFVILLIVYNSFCDSMINGVWSQFSVTLLAFSIFLCAVILLFITRVILKITHLCKFSVEDEIAALFCGTKKTLAAGVPMAQVIFGSDPRLGMILLPIILYHPMQIFYCAILANRYGKRN
jgi:sodium/bile acid cotransporter 7